jgi:hypothetical protein
MSGKTEPSRKIDSRVKHTRDALGDGLLALMQEKPFESITVQEILDRAGIGRSTFTRTATKTIHWQRGRVHGTHVHSYSPGGEVQSGECAVCIAP